MPSEHVLGKRKRKPAQKVDEDTDAAAVEDAQAIFRKHFEAQFAPIQDETDTDAESAAGKGKNAKTTAESEDENDGGIEDMRSDSESDGEDDNEWGGLSEEDDDDSSQDGDGDAESDSDAEADEVQIVDHSKPLPSSSTLAAQNATMTKREMRAYLSSRPPDAASADRLAVSNAKAQAGEDDDPQNEDSKTLLANDLALQRLISESHILSASNPFNAVGRGGDSSSSSSSAAAAAAAFAEGRTRRLTTDLRLQRLGSKGSIFAQQKMPMGMRKGISAAREAKEDRRRREARENGIILEKAAAGGQQGAGKKAKRSKGRGGLAVDMPGMGRFKDGELRLSKSEVRAVEMEGMRMDDRGKRKRRRR